MCLSEKFQLSKYIPARVTEGKVWFISFYVFNPGINKLERIRIKINRISNVRQKRKLARQMVIDINVKLSNGWNPIIESEASKSYHKLIDVMKTFIATKEKELRPDSMRAYKSYISILDNYILKNLKNKDIYVINFDKNIAINFMQYNYMNNSISERSYNNYVAFYRLFFNWCLQLNYCTVNPFASISKKKEKQKTRILIDLDAKEKLKEYLFDRNYEYFVICMMTYYGLLRPKEITYVRIKDVDLTSQRIFLSGKFTKNGKDRRPTIPDVLKNYLQKLKLEEYNPELYLFSSDFKPGKVRLDSRVIAKYWAGLRLKINIPKEMQFYSLKDTGITQMVLDRVPLKDIMEQADHSSLEITSVYVKHANTFASEEIKKRCVEF